MSDRMPYPLIEVATPVAHPSTGYKGGAIHTRSFKGLYRTLRISFAGALFVLFFGTAWLNWNGRQAVLWDLSESKFHVFASTFWPQDFILLSALLIICAFGLFAVTVFAGRVWCGYSCPQSTWTWLYMWCEKISEGDRNQRLKLAASPWSLTKLARRTVKHALWLAIAVLTGLTFVGYFTPIRPLAAELLSFQLGGVALFWVLFFTGATYLNAGFLREAVCMHMCPYARFQAVMFDSDTLAVAYDPQRGEHRGPRKKGSDPRAQQLGDCVDCTLCVQVCPTGIDIRDGLQMACIGCAACVDACDGVMDKMGYPRGLVGYMSEHTLQGGSHRWLRPRLLGYATALLVMVGALVLALHWRPMVSLDVIKDRGLFRENALGQIENIYLLKVINKTPQPQRYHVRLVNGEGFTLQGKRELLIPAGEMNELPVSVALLAERPVSNTRDLIFEVQDSDEPSVRSSARSRFVAPLNR
ncbi:cytochrome c oxidase accessory protein CcoG [Pseudomonas sp. BP8]|uniref:cytochrome c oxidase accessory protein CcoG n=1 Tax=Pseudomonas sp. BP8 TaxID=2817864 RepID=UPI001AE52511|nr:cytochrome c oxidase accessory protein CcoG [Pseudomonas sp. BP8]MBP2262062.1 cytochrome c oxidase accessory protein FixG [Pseudomonas sp. BP8]HDS1735441.1 cytochrome c oxidase accessory protein CcoG [Pseudomonas putida]